MSPSTTPSVSIEDLLGEGGRSRLPVKVCGIRTPRDLAAAEGATLIGVVLGVPSSPRDRTLEQAASIFRRAEGRFGRVAVLVDPDAEGIRSALRIAGADLVQVHGRLPAGLLPAELSRVVPSIPVPPPRSERSQTGSGGKDLEVPSPPASSSHPYIHLDRGGALQRGGTGLVADWERCRRLVVRNPGRRFMLAGGLTPENVAEAVRKVRPFAVDVSSGVESRPGEKSREKVERFLRALG